MAGIEDLGIAEDCYPITPNDNAKLATPIRALRAANAGYVRVDTASGTDRVLAFLAGETRYISIIKVYATGTTATVLEGMV